MNTDILISFLILIAFFILATARSWLKSRIAAMEDEHLRTAVTNLVEAAEQIFSSPGMGESKKAFVVNSLTELDYDITNYIDALVEAAVFRLKE